MSFGQYFAYGCGLALVAATLVLLIAAWHTDPAGVGGWFSLTGLSAAAVLAFALGGLAMRVASRNDGIKWPDWPFVQMSKWGGDEDDDDYM